MRNGEYIVKLFESIWLRRRAFLLELGCGTGTVTELLARKRV